MIAKKIILSFIFLVISIVVTNCASSSPPLPDVLNIVPPSPEVPSQLAAFSGKWKGALSNGQEIFLIVEEINIDKASIIMSYGTFYDYKGFYQYHEGKILSDSSIQIVDTYDMHTFILNEKQNKLSVRKKNKFTSLWTEGTLLRNPE